ncbi:MAG: YeeE/YedE family protein [Bacteroidales bacterium]|nr:YeeE/YedE family protein [Bacteroidales bacterium]
MSKIKSGATANIAETMNTDFEVRSLDAQTVNGGEKDMSFLRNLKFMLAGIFFGLILVKSEVISWFRIQEMFRLESFHMYGVIGTAVVVGIISILLIKKLKIKTIHGDAIEFQDKRFTKGQVIGGLIFGLGWAITGACPGPLLAQLGSGVGVISITILSAVAGTWVYGKFRDKLPN